MARTERTPDEFERIASELSEAANTLLDVASKMKEQGMPFALVHGTLPTNTHIPAVLDWVGKIQAEVKSQLRAHQLGVQSSAELHKQKNENAKLAAAKKPWKKATKKKTT